jgi:hypothetical protein
MEVRLHLRRVDDDRVVTDDLPQPIDDGVDGLHVSLPKRE